VLGTQTFGASYHFTGEAPTAETTSVNPRLASHDKAHARAPSGRRADQTLADIARCDPTIKRAIEMPFVNELQS
jgi:hypothetical protein